MNPPHRQCFEFRVSSFEFARLSAMLMLLAFLTGCPAPNDRHLNVERPAVPPITYTQLAEQYNRRTANITQLWSRSVIEINWTDEDGKKHFEQGDGPLIVRKPHDLALAIGKGGFTIYWLGANADRYWLLELDPPADQPKAAYVGRHDKLAETSAREQLVLPISPSHLVHLLGVQSLPMYSEQDAPPVIVADGSYRAVLPAEDDNSPAVYYTIDPKTFRPQRIELIDREGRSLVQASLARYQLLPLTGQPKGAWPYIPTRIELTIPDRHATATLFLGDPIDGKADNKVKDIQFDFDKLRAAQQIDPANVIDLDAPVNH